MGYGANVPDSSKCPTYKMTIDVTVDGDHVKGRFQQEGRPERGFETTLLKGGHSMTLLALVRSAGGIDSPRLVAVLRLTPKSNIVGGSIGKSAGLAPLSILSAMPAARR